MASQFFTQIDRNLRERIADIEHPLFKGFASSTFRFARFFFIHVHSSGHLIATRISLLFRAVYSAKEIPSYAYRTLIKNTPPEEVVKDQNEAMLVKWLQSTLLIDLDTTQVAFIRRAICGKTSVRENKAFFNGLIPLSRFADLDQVRTQWGIKLDLARRAIEKIDAPSKTLIQIIEERQGKEKEIVLQLGGKLKYLSDEELSSRVSGDRERAYCFRRAMEIQDKLSFLDDGRELFNHVTRGTDGFAELRGRIEEYQESVDRGVFPEIGTRADYLAAWEYGCLLAELCDLREASIHYDRYKHHIEDLNRITQENALQLHQTLEDRCKKVSALLPSVDLTDEFAKLNPKEDIALFMSGASQLMDKLHELELSELKRNTKLVPTYYVGSGADCIKELSIHIDRVMETDERLALLSIQERFERQKTRRESIASKALRLCIERTPDGVQLNRLRLLDSSTAEFRRLKAASEGLLDQFFTRYRSVIFAHIFTTSEYVDEIGGSDIDTLTPMRVYEFDPELEKLFDKLELRFDGWQRDLQQIYVDHMGVEAKEAVFALPKSMRNDKMNELFSTWMTERTGLPFARKLSFARFEMVDDTKERAAALDLLKQHMRPDGKLDPKKASKTRGAASELAEFEGVALSTIEFDKPRDVTPTLDVDPGPFVEIRDDVEGPEDVVEVFTRMKFLESDIELDAQIEGTIKASREPEGVKHEEIFVWGSFMEIFSKIGVRASAALLDAYVNFVIEHKIFEKDNSFRRDSAHAYLSALFKEEPDSVKVTRLERDHLVQLAAIAEATSLPKFELVDLDSESDLKESFVYVMGATLQASEVGIEGVEDATLQSSLQKSAIMKSYEVREWIDALRARHEMPIRLLKYVEKAYPIEHDQGQEMMARAISYALQKDELEDIDQFFSDALATCKPSPIDARTFALPKRIFYLDCYAELAAAPPSAVLEELDAFDDALISSTSNAGLMVMGYARKISRMTRFLTEDMSVEAFANYIKHKVAFQKLCVDQIDDKVEVGGFLKIAIDRAHVAMARSVLHLKANKEKFTPEELVEGLVATEQSDPSKFTFAEKTVRRMFKNQQRGRLPVKFEEPIFLSFGNSHLDLVTGAFYSDGSQLVDLPAILQNHPHVRALQLHDLPYVKGRDGSYTHFTREGGVSKAQVKITLDVDANPIVQRRLPTSFDLPSTLASLQYVSIEQFNQIPAAVAQRMDIKHFWVDCEKNIYGFSEKGQLIAVLDTDFQVRTKEGVFAFADGRFSREVIRVPVESRRSEWTLASAAVMGVDLTRVTAIATQAMMKFHDGVLSIRLLIARFTRWVDSNVSIDLTSVTAFFAVAAPLPDPTSVAATRRFAAVLERLDQCVSRDEILVDESKDMVWVPSVDLRLSLKEDKLWHCEGANISGMVLDFEETPRPGVLVLKPEGKENSLLPFERNLKQVRGELVACRAVKGSSLQHKAKIKELEKQMHEIRLKMAKARPRLYFSVLPEATDVARQRVILNRLIERMVDTTRRIDGARDAEESRRLQAEYLKHEKEYTEAQSFYDLKCATKRKVALFDSYTPEGVSGRDLQALLFLLTHDLETSSSFEPRAWVEQIAKYPLNSPFSDDALEALETTYSRYEHQDELALFLGLILCQNYNLRLRNLMGELSLDKAERQREMLEKLGATKDRCLEIYEPLSKRGTKFSSALLALLHVHIPGVHAFPDLACFPGLPMAPSSVRELRALAAQSLMERCDLDDRVRSTPTNAGDEIKEGQKRLVRGFKNHSPDQVRGFYLEEFGMFQPEMFRRVFDYDPRTKRGLFGLEARHLDHMFNALRSNGWIEARSSTDFLFSVTTKKGNPLTLVQKESLIPVLAEVPLSSETRELVANRIRSFLFLAAQASFTFTWFDDIAESEFKAQMFTQLETHTQQMLDAQFILDDYLKEVGVTLVEFKRRVMMSQLDPEDRNLNQAYHALVRFLVHKTEVQHIQNVMKAPMKGERNQIELLSTARQYPIEMLLADESELRAPQREERILQLAFLLFEEDFGGRCNAMQFKLLRSLMLDPSNEESIDAMQARMGFGKTALLPLMALVQIAKEAHLPPNEKSLVRYVVPRAVLQDNHSAFNTRISHILGASVLQDREFSRYQIDPDDSVGSFEWVIRDLEDRLRIYENARNQGLPIIQWPEIRQSMEAQELAFGFSYLSGELDEDSAHLCLRAKQLLGKVRSMVTYTVFDELDATQDFKACEVNFTEGKKLPILRETVQPIYKLIGAISMLRLPRGEVLARSLLIEFGYDASDALVAFLTDPKMGVDDVAALLPHPTRESEKYASIFLMRAILLDPNMFAFVVNKQPNTHFGVRFKDVGGERVYSYDPYSESKLLIAVPYEGTNTPKGLSTFDNTEVAAIATMRYYASNETLFEIDPHLEFLITQTKRGVIPPELEKWVEDTVDTRGNTLVERLRAIAALLDPVELEKAKQDFYKDFFAAPTSEVRSYFGMVVVATQVCSDEGRANSNRYEMGSTRDQMRGCSGTVGSTSSYFVNPADDPAADGKMSLEIMGREENAPVAILRAYDETSEYLDYILDALLEHAKSTTRAIIDAAGVCKSKDGNPETIVAALWTKIQGDAKFEGIKGIVYYGKDNIKRVYRGTALPPIPCSTQMELQALAGKEYFSFYGQKNTRGSDIKQADGAHALVTMDENVPNSDAKQAILRFRSLVKRSSAQTFTYAVTPKYAEMLAGDADILAPTISQDLRLKEKHQERDDALLLFRKELAAHVKQAASTYEHQLFDDIDLSHRDHEATYKAFLAERDRIVPLLEKACVKLEDKYGGALTHTSRDEHISDELKRFRARMDELDALVERTRSALRIAEPLEEVRAFFDERAERSVDLFTSRYPQDCMVQVSAVDSGAEAVAMALAQAEAQAMAEAVAEAIAEAVVEVRDRLRLPKVRMRERTPFEVAPEWLESPTCVEAARAFDMVYAIHPEHYDQVGVSPHLEQAKLITHYALVPSSPKEQHIYVSQKEADAWMRALRHGDPVDARYELVDLRDVDVRDGVLACMRAAVLLGEERFPDGIASTDDLRKVRLTNAGREQLVPQLEIELPTDLPLDRYVDLSTFGVSAEGSTDMTLQLEGGTFTIGTAGGKVAIPKENKWLQPLFAEVFSTDATDKCATLERRFNEETAALRKRLLDLRAQQDALASKKAQISSLLEDSTAFTITGTMRSGCEERDAELRDVSSLSRIRIYYQSNDYATRDQASAYIQNCGGAFLAKMEEIQAAQAEVKRLSDDPEAAETALRKLEGVVNSTMSERVKKFEGSFGSAVIFGPDHWKVENFETMPPFDLVYGRILYTVHTGNLAGASGCARADCNALFSRILPGIRTALGGMQKAIDELPGVNADIKRIEAEIKELEALTLGLDEAEKCVKAMKGSKDLTAACAREGVLLEANQRSDAPPCFWDGFKLDQLFDWKDFSTKLTLKGHLPAYATELYANDVTKYEERMRVLSEEETLLSRAHSRLSKRTLELARQVERRERDEWRYTPLLTGAAASATGAAVS